MGEELHFNEIKKEEVEDGAARSTRLSVTKWIDPLWRLWYKKLGISVMSLIPIIRNSKLQAFGASKEVKRRFSRKHRRTPFSITISLRWEVL